MSAEMESGTATFSCWVETKDKTLTTMGTTPLFSRYRRAKVNTFVRAHRRSVHERGVEFPVYPPRLFGVALLVQLGVEVAQLGQEKTSFVYKYLSRHFENQAELRNNLFLTL